MELQGKSATLNVIATFAYQPRRFNLRGKTLPVVRDELEASYQGTAIIEEADQGWKDELTFERLLSDRYHRQSAETGLKEKSGDKWVSTTKRTFGATVLHRRITFNDAALDGRSITIRFRFDSTRQYVEVSDDRQPWLVEGRELIKNLVFVPIAIDQLQGVAPRIFNTYRPLFVIAKLCGDEGFAQLILESLLVDTAQLKEDQSVEPDGLVLRAVISLVFLGSAARFANIKFSDIASWIWENHRVSLQPKKIGALAREELGFTTTESHGLTVVVPTPASLLKACRECGYEDNPRPWPN